MFISTRAYKFHTKIATVDISQWGKERRMGMIQSTKKKVSIYKCELKQFLEEKLSYMINVQTDVIRATYLCCDLEPHSLQQG